MKLFLFKCYIHYETHNVLVAATNMDHANSLAHPYNENAKELPGFYVGEAGILVHEIND